MAADEPAAAPDEYFEQFQEPLNQAIRVLGSRGLLGAKCPICQGDEWVSEMSSPATSSQAGNKAPVFAMKDPRGYFGPAPAILTLAFTCTACGFLRQHNVAWLVSLGEKGDG